MSVNRGPAVVLSLVVHVALATTASTRACEPYWSDQFRSTYFHDSVLAFAVFGLSLMTIPVLGLQLFPKAEKSLFLVNIRLPGEANLSATSLISERVEEVLAAEPGIRDFTVNIGKGSPMIYYNVERDRERTNFAQVLVNLEGGNADEFAAELAPKLRRMAGATVVPKVLEQGPVGGAAIQVRVTGPDLNVLSGLAQGIQGRIADVPGIADLRDTLGDTAAVR